ARCDGAPARQRARPADSATQATAAGHLPGHADPVRALRRGSGQLPRRHSGQHRQVAVGARPPGTAHGLEPDDAGAAGSAARRHQQHRLRLLRTQLCRADFDRHRRDHGLRRGIHRGRAPRQFLWYPVSPGTFECRGCTHPREFSERRVHMILIPSIDLRNGRCVRLLKGNFDAETRYDLEPHELLQRYRALGATWLHVVDLDGAKHGRLANRSVILRLASQKALHIQVGGGVRSKAVVDDLLRNGIDRVIVGSAAVEKPDEVRAWIEQYGAEKIGLAFDIRHVDGIPRVLTRGWTRESKLTLWEAIDSYLSDGLKHVLCTDADLDGAMMGPAVALYQEFTKRYPQLQLQASGGVRSAADLQALAAAGSAAAISGKALLEEAIQTVELRPFLPNASSPASTSATARS